MACTQLSPSATSSSIQGSGTLPSISPSAPSQRPAGSSPPRQERQQKEWVVALGTASIITEGEGGTNAKTYLDGATLQTLLSGVEDPEGLLAAASGAPTLSSSQAAPLDGGSAPSQPAGASAASSQRRQPGGQQPHVSNGPPLLTGESDWQRAQKLEGRSSWGTPVAAANPVYGLGTEQPAGASGEMWTMRSAETWLITVSLTGV